MSFTLDTHTAVSNLEAAGMAREQAEAVVETIRRADSHLATKADLTALRSWAEVQIAEMRTELQRTVNRVLIAQVGLTALLFAALQLFD